MKYKTMEHPKQNKLGDFCKQNPKAEVCKPTVEDKQNIEQEHKQAIEIVEELLKTDEKARNSDLWLTLQVWQKAQQIKVFVPYDKFDQMMNPETIARARRVIQNTNEKYLPTDPKILIRRRVKESVLRNYFATKPEVLSKYDEEIERRGRK